MMPTTSVSVPEAAAYAFGLRLVAPPRLIRDGENQVYELQCARQGQLALRVHRDGYHDDRELRSEAEWLSALAGAGHPVPATLRTADGDLVALAGDPVKRCTVLRWLPGVPLTETDPSLTLPVVGRLLAGLHEHAASWTPPTGFTRAKWDAEALCGEGARWGHWSKATSWEPGLARLLEEATAVTIARLKRLGQTSEVFGLIHADLTPSNGLWHGGVAHAIDFDDCGDGWLCYDIAAALWEWEERADFPRLRTGMLDAYAESAGRRLPGETELPTMLMARRLALLGWLDGRRGTRREITAGPERIATTPRRVRDFLRWAETAPDPAP